MRLNPPPLISELNERSREIFRHIVDALRRDRRAGRLAHAVAPARAEPVAGDHPQRHGRSRGGRAAAWRRTPRPADCRPMRGCASSCTGCSRSAASREDERRSIDSQCAAAGKSVAQALEEATTALSGPVALRRPGPRAQDRAAAEAYRVRPSRARPRPRRHGDRGRAGREPRHRRAARAAAVVADQRRQLPQRAAGRPHARRGEARRSPRISKATAPSSTS